MSIGKACTKKVAVADQATTITAAARQMRKRHVGDIVVIRESKGKKIPVGMVTDRDIVLAVVATGLDPAVFTVGDLIMRDLVTCREDLGILECIQQMRLHGVRRMPVLAKDGGLLGIVAVDDLIRLLAEELADVAKLISREQKRESRTRI